MMNRIKTGVRDYWNTRLFPVEASDPTLAVEPWDARRQRIAALVLVAACVVVLLPFLSYPLIEPDETRYAQLALNMLETGDWTTPKLDGKPYLDKPPLLYWITATSFTIFGQNEIAARLPPIAAAMATVLMLYWLGRRIVNPRAAWLSAIALLLCGGFVLSGRFLLLDSLLTCFVTATLLCAYIAVRGQRHHWGWWFAAAVLCALGVLTKGPVAVVLCVPPLMVCGWLRNDQTRIGMLPWIAFGMSILVICVPWYIVVWLANSEFGQHFFWEHNFKRFTHGSNHREPLLFYVPVIFVGMFPTSLLLPTVIVFLVGRKDHKQQLRSKDLGFVFCSAMWVLVFFSASSCKIPTYILPAIPMLCMATGVMLDRTVFNTKRVTGIKTFLQPFPQRASLIVLLSGAMVWGVDLWLGGWSGVPHLAIAGVIVALTAVTLTYWNREVAFADRGWAFFTLAAMVMIGVTFWRFVPTFAETRSLYSKTAAVFSDQPNDGTVIFYGERPHAAKLQLPDAEVVYFPAKDQNDFVSFIAGFDRVIVITGDERIHSTRDAVSATHELASPSDHEHLYVARRIQQVPSTIAESREKGRR